MFRLVPMHISSKTRHRVGIRPLLISCLILLISKTNPERPLQLRSRLRRIILLKDRLPVRGPTVVLLRNWRNQTPSAHTSSKLDRPRRDRSTFKSTTSGRCLQIPAVTQAAQRSPWNLLADVSTVSLRTSDHIHQREKRFGFSRRLPQFSKTPKERDTCSRCCSCICTMWNHSHKN